MTSKDYDRDIDVLSSKDEEFNISVKRSIEPGALSVYDSIVDMCEKKHLKLLSRIGDALYIDTLDIDKGYTEDPEDGIVESVKDEHYHSMGFNWPYFSYGTKNNKVFVMNAFNPGLIQRFQLLPKVRKIAGTFLTDTYDLYVITETREETFATYHIDLSLEQPRVSEAIFEYPLASVGGKAVTSFHVRGSSDKEKINLNKKLLLFMMHGSDLWCYK